MSIKMIVNICTCCDSPADVCNFQRTLKDLGAEKFGIPWIEEREIPSTTSSLRSRKA